MSLYAAIPPEHIIAAEMALHPGLGRMQAINAIRCRRMALREQGTAYGATVQIDHRQNFIDAYTRIAEVVAIKTAQVEKRHA